MNQLLFGFPGGMELVVIFLVLLLIFGHRLPGLARSLGKGVTEFKRGLKEPADSKGAEALPSVKKKEPNRGE